MRNSLETVVYVGIVIIIMLLTLIYSSIKDASVAIINFTETYAIEVEE